jgi:hypothetical protein
MPWYDLHSHASWRQGIMSVLNLSNRGRDEPTYKLRPIKLLPIVGVASQGGGDGWVPQLIFRLTLLVHHWFIIGSSLVHHWFIIGSSPTPHRS